MYIKEVSFTENSNPKHFIAEVTLDKDAIFNSMRKWLESFKDSFRDTVFSIGNIIFEPDILNDIYYDSNMVSDEDIDAVVKQMQTDWNFVIGDKLLVEGGGSFVSFIKAEEKILESIDEDNVSEVPDSVLLDVGFYLDIIKPEVQDTILKRVALLEKEEHWDR